MDSKGLGGSGGSVGVITEIVDISRSQGNAKSLWPSIAVGRGDQMIAVHAPEQNMWNMTSNVECPLSNAQASGFLGTSARVDFDVGTSNSFLSQVTDGKQLHRRLGNVVRSNSGSSKRSRIVQIEVSMNETGVEDANEKPQITRQKSTANGKQRDKRNGKLSKSRTDPFSLKNGLVSFSSVAGGGNFLAFGSKSGNFDATNHVDELPLDELLDGSYTCQSLVKDKGKAVQNMDDNNLLNSFRKAFSVLQLQLQSPVPTQKTVELEQDNDQKASTCSTADAGSPESRTNGNGEAICASNQPSINKDCIARTKVVSTLVGSPLYEPKDVLNLLMLPPPKELDTLLLDAVMKPASSSKNSNDLRLGKTISHRTGLPPFHWSLNPSGHSKSGPDAFKLAANRPSCQGRWLKVENIFSSPKVSNNGFLVDFETLSFDHRLIPVVNQQFRPLEKKNAASLVSNEQAVSSSSATCPASQVPLAEHSSGLWAAAETLFEISSYSSKEVTHDTFEQLKKCQKPMKTSKSKPDGKSGRLAPPASAPSMGSENLLKKTDGTYPSKKHKFSAIGHAESARHSKHGAAISPMNWSAPRSIRSSTGGKLLKDSVPQSKYSRNSSSSSILKKSYMMMPPPSSRFIDKASSGNNQLKLKDKLQRETN